VFRRRKDGTARTGTPSEWVIVGLGNPGIEHRGTRHNLGEAIVEEFAARHGGDLRVETRLRARAAELTLDGHRLLVAVPTTFMNESAASVVPLVRRGGIDDLGRLLVVHDELDFAPGRLQLRLGGGLAGHNGLRSIAGALGTQEFTRLRVGIGKPETKDRGATWVLSRPGRDEREVLDAAVLDGADAIETLVTAGMDAAVAKLATRG
jgi:peptidyl-tRNA hydrolase, PTH1 family